MTSSQLYTDIATRTGGDIYIGADVIIGQTLRAPANTGVSVI